MLTRLITVLILVAAGLAWAQTLTVVTRENLIEANRNFSTTLSAGINNSTLTIPLTSGAGITISVPGAIVIGIGTSPNVEYVKLCSISGNTATACAGGRGFSGTSALTHSSGAAVVGGLLTPESYNAIVVALAQTTAALGTNLAGLVVFQTTAPATCTANQLPLWFDSNATPGENLYGCTATDTWTLLSGGGGGGSGDWIIYTIAETQLTTASLTEDETLFTCTACIVERVHIKHSTAFSGGTLTGMTVSVGFTGEPACYAPAFDIFQATGSTAKEHTITGPCPAASQVSHTVSARFTATGDNVVNATAGSVDIWVKTSTLP